MLLGNPHIWCESLPKEDAAAHWAFVQSWFYHGLLPYTLYEQWGATGCNSNAGSGTEACQNLYHTVRNAAGIGGNIDQENLRKDHCAGNGSIGGSIEHSESRDQCQSKTLLGPVFGYKAYLSGAAVQQTAHVQSPAPRHPAGKDPRFHYARSNESVIVSWRRIFQTFPGLKSEPCTLASLVSPYPLFVSLVDCAVDLTLRRWRGDQVLIYSGDQDIATNPSFLTQTCLNELSDDRGSTTKSWSSWKVNHWHAGYVEYFSRYAFATVQGAGHRVPENQPLATVAMYERFIANGTLDTVA